MIPPVLPASCPSGGEREIFVRLRDEPGTEDWIALHSLDIASHLRQIAGEADFVIIVPRLGVLCLEVKGCHSLRRDDGMWFYGSDAKGDARGPFKQAADAMHSLRQQVARSDPALVRVPFWSAVAFPFVEFQAASDEWHRWQVIDSTRFRRQPVATLVSSVLRNARSRLASQSSTAWFKETDGLPNVQQAAAIARILRPNFEFNEKSRDRRKRQQVEVLRYTEEQFVALDTMADNDRVVFTGPAGTGKTVLALEAARRAATAGKEVLFLCFNRLLGKWISQHPVCECGRVRAGTLHQYLTTLAASRIPDDAPEVFWKLELPEMAASQLLSGHADSARFDLIVADEFQDLIAAPYLDVLDLALKGGLAGGRWLMFADFERQMLYGQDRGELEELLKLRLGAFSRGSLRVNCRNTPRIAALSHLLGRLTPNYSRVLRPDDRVEPFIRYYATPSQQRKEVVSILEMLGKQSFVGDDIVVLSPKAPARCAAAGITDKPWAELLASYECAVPGQVRYTTVQSFKGLDSPAIVVTDIEHLGGELFSSLFYVATTRALERLCIIAHETVKADIVSALIGND